VWDKLGLDNKRPLSGQAIGNFYIHPVWVMNGVFTAVDPESIRHRDLIASYLSRMDLARVADYGGGFGELALKLHSEAPHLQVDIVEPYPSSLGMSRVEGVEGIRFIREFENQYDCVVAQDVLEHVERPLVLAGQLVQATKSGGLLIFANCFYPVIKCHLPATFYLRHTFVWVMWAMGLEYLGRVRGVGHAQVFRKTGNINYSLVAAVAGVAQLIGPFLNAVWFVLRKIKHKFGNA